MPMLSGSRPALAVAALIAAMVALPPAASAYKTLKEDTGTTGETRWWIIDLPIRYSINSSGSADITNDTEFTAIQNAFKTWGGPTCSYLSSEYLGTTGDTVRHGDGRNTFDWVENKADWPPEAGPNAIAFTVPMFDGSGRFFEADMRFNGVNYTWITSGNPSGNRMDVETIALHELGHVLGLADLYDYWTDHQKVMYGYNSGSIKRTLNSDDSDGICYLYPKGDEGTCNYDNDCAPGQYCVGYQSIHGESGFLCAAPVGTMKPGQRCGDVKGTPGNLGDDVRCVNGMCLDSRICSKMCDTPDDCPYNMGCSEVTTTDPYGGSVTFKGCSTPPGCVRAQDCDLGKRCGLYRAGDSFAMACITPAGPGDLGESCSKWDDCTTGICFNGYCSWPCDVADDCNGNIDDYKCTAGAVTGQDGKTGKFAICVRKDAPDGGVVPGKDSGVSADSGVVQDSGTQPDDSGFDTDGGALGDAGDNPPPCDCDQTYDCDPDCSCDPECAPPDDQPVTNGCSCSSVGI